MVFVPLYVQMPHAFEYLTMHDLHWLPNSSSKLALSPSPDSLASGDGGSDIAAIVILVVVVPTLAVVTIDKFD